MYLVIMQCTCSHYDVLLVRISIIVDIIALLKQILIVGTVVTPII